MDAIKIESTVPAEKIHHIIEGIPIKKDVSISFEKYEDRFRYIFSLNNKKLNDDSIFLESLTKFVEELIIDFYADEIIASKLDQKLGKVDDATKLEIIEDVKEVLLSKTLFIKEKRDIKEELLNYFIEDSTLIVDGYLNFRSRSYHDLIEKSVELVLGDFQLEVEYEEFIDMLKELIESQESEIDMINIVMKEGNYIILDENFNTINNNHISLVLEGLSSDEVSSGDILLSTIIALAPKNLVIHLGKNEKDDLTYILEEIFADRVRICRNCEICNK